MAEFVNLAMAFVFAMVIVIAVSAVIIVIARKYFWSKGISTKTSKFHRHLANLCKGKVGFVIFNDPDGFRLIQFKNTDDSNNRTLVYALPNCGWSQPHIEDILILHASSFSNFDLKHSFAPASDALETPMEFINIDFRDDYSAASKFAIYIWHEIYKLDGDRVKIYFSEF